MGTHLFGSPCILISQSLYIKVSLEISGASESQ